MPHYFFHLYNGLDVPDLEGIELQGADAARAFALRECREMMCETIRSGRITLSHYVEVEDAHHSPLFTVRFGDAVIIEN